MREGTITENGIGQLGFLSLSRRLTARCEVATPHPTPHTSHARCFNIIFLCAYTS